MRRTLNIAVFSQAGFDSKTQRFLGAELVLVKRPAASLEP